MLTKVDALGLKFSKEARVEILIEEAVKTAAIEGQALHRDSVRSSVARRLGLPTAGLPATERVVDGLAGCPLPDRVFRPAENLYRPMARPGTDADGIRPCWQRKSKMLSPEPISGACLNSTSAQS